MESDSRNDSLAEALAAERERGREEGRERGLEQGRVEAIESACRLLGITIDTERRAFLLTCNAAELERLLLKIESTRRWAGP